MRPDYPSKIFNDKRTHYVLLIQSLAEEAGVDGRLVG
jgi:hypothetical protein